VCRVATDFVCVYNSKNRIVYWYGIAHFTDVELAVLNAFNNLKTLKVRNMQQCF